MAFQLLFSAPLTAQLPLVRGTSASTSGMLYYNFREADDLRPRVYVQTICPPQTSCLQLDFTLLESPQQRDFIRVFDGPDRDAPLVATLGGSHGSQLLQCSSGCLTVEFMRAEAGTRTRWTALWHSQMEGDCIDPDSAGPCAGIQDICGLEFRENRPQLHANWSKLPSTEFVRGDGSRWYRFVAARDGELRFSLLPDNGKDDFDWLLLAAPMNGQCPVQTDLSGTLAYNLAAGAGALGATGMNERGSSSRELATGNPFSSPISLEKGRSYYLLVSSPQSNTAGFRLIFNEAVLKCGNPGGEFIQVAHKPTSVKRKISARDAFSRNTQVLRIDLDEKSNLPLSSCAIPGETYASLFASKGPKFAKTVAPPPPAGLTSALISGLRTGLFPAFAANDFAHPIHYGDLLDFAYRMSPTELSEISPEDSIYGPATRNYWSLSPDVFDGFGQVIELISDTYFDKQSGRKQVQIRYIRLIWSDWEGQLPDYNVAIFRYPDVSPLLASLLTTNHHNDVRQTSVQDVFDRHQYKAFVTWQSGKAAGSPATGKYLQSRAQQLEDYIWSR